VCVLSASAPTATAVIGGHVVELGAEQLDEVGSDVAALAHPLLQGPAPLRTTM
jgi:hypothetical protein